MSDVAAAIGVLETLSERVVATRKARGLSYRRAAEQIDVTASTMWGIEHGKRDPGVIITLRVLRWLDEGHEWD